MSRTTPVTAALATLLLVPTMMLLIPTPVRAETVTRGDPAPAPALADAAVDRSAPPRLTAAAITWIDYTRGGAEFAALSPGAGSAFTARLVDLYAVAAAQEPVPPAQVVSPPFAPPRDYSPRVQILTADRELVTLRARPGSDSQVDIRWETAAGSGSQTVAAPDLRAFIGTAADQFPAPTSWTVTPREGVRMGAEQQIAGGDFDPTDALHVFLAPARPRGPESAPPPYPAPDAALLATYRDWPGGSLDLHIRLADTVGTRPDGQPLRVVPGPYSITVVSEGLTLASGVTWGGFQMEAGFTLLPEPPEPRAVAVQGDRVLTWTPDAGVRSAPLPDGARPRRGPHQSTVVPSALATSLGLAVTRPEPGTEVWSAGEATVTMTAGSQHATAGPGGLDLLFPAAATGDPPGLAVNFSQLAPFFEYEVRWVGPDAVYFRRGVPAEPPALLAALGHPAPPDPAAFAIVINGQPPAGPAAILVGGTTYLPLRAAGEALQARVHWDADTETGSVQAADWQVVVPPGQVQVRRGDRTETLSRGPINRGGRLFVPLRAVTEALGGQVIWDPENWTIWITLH